MTVTETGVDTRSGLWVPIAELARMRGLARPAMYRKVDGLVGRGLLELRLDERGAKLVSPAQYDRAIAQGGDLGRLQGAATRRARSTTVSPTVPPDVVGGPVYTREQARRTAYLADLAHIELQERLGRLTSVDELRAAATRAAEEIVGVIERLPLAADDLAAALSLDGVHGLRVSLRATARRMRDEIAASLTHVVPRAPSEGTGAAGAIDERIGTG